MAANIRLTVKGLAKFMTGNATQQRKVLSDFKNPKPEGKVQRDYYRDARNAIATFHRESRPVTWLHSRADNLDVQATMASEGLARIHRSNARAIRDYARNFSSRKFTIRAVHPAYRINFGNVTISCAPDLVVEERGKVRYIKLEFDKDQPDDHAIKIIGQTMFEALSAAAIDVKSSNVLVFDVARGKVLKGARAGARMLTEIDNACKNIATIWPTI